MWMQVRVCVCDGCHVDFGPDLPLFAYDVFTQGLAEFWVHFCSSECMKAWKEGHLAAQHPLLDSLSPIHPIHV